jgi:AcrR family transcriptional regulator
MTGRREQYREQTREEIKAAARAQMESGGWPAISLNAIAKTMGVAVSGLYRYFENRDALLTALILDAYNGFGAAIEQAEAAHQPRDDYAGRLLAALRAYRAWALENRAEFGLIYGTPVPGYHAPEELTVPAASRPMRVVLGIVMEAIAAGTVQPAAQDDLPPVMAMDVPLAAAQWGVRGWTRIHGFVTLDAFGHLDNVVPDRDAFYDAECRALLAQSGF